MDGFLNVYKPLGITSSDAVLMVRKLLPRGTRVGHGGTLDPEAEGVLPVCIGKAARLFDYIIDKQKTYIAELKLGISTDTQDAVGTVIRRGDASGITREMVEAVLPHFVGDVKQVPPMYSALKRDGKRLYELARKGEEVELEARDIRIDAVTLLDMQGDVCTLQVDCGKGVYIRTLCSDIGDRLGCGGHMLTLKRSRAGAFDGADALMPDMIRSAAAQGTLEEKLMPLDYPLSHYPMLDLDGECTHAVKNGNPIPPEKVSGGFAVGTVLRVYLEGRFAGMGEITEDGGLRFRAMLMTFEA